jgi:alpha-L-arabinofuranosidase
MFSQNRGDVVVPTEVQSPSTLDKPKGGAIGVGTWMTQAEFKDIQITRGGETLFAADFASGLDGWKQLGGGNWKVQDGVLRQSSTEPNIRVVTTGKNWTDYTYSLKARKLGGAEGFLILFRVTDDDAKSWWNIGGWGNQRHAIEMGGIISNEVPGQIETGRWYDIRIEVKGSRIKCYLDGKLIHDAKSPAVESLYASATRVRTSGEVILKVVNVASDEMATDIQLAGVSGLAGPAKVTVLASAKPTDENSLAEPTKVAPVTQTLGISSPSFRHVFPGNSVTVIRLKPGR